MNNAEVVCGTIKLRPIYQCRGCGTRQYGDTYEARVHCLDDIVSHVQYPALPASRMPVGWVSYTDGIFCPNCKR